MMEALLQLLTESVAGMQADAQVIAENHRAMNTMAEDICKATKEQAERKQAAYAAKRRAYVSNLPVHDVFKEETHA